MSTITLRGADVYLTHEPTFAFRVCSGTLLVFAVPVQNGVPGRRTLIAECKTGAHVPALHTDSQELGEWMFLLCGLGEATIETLPGKGSEVVLEFARSIGMALYAPEDFAAEVIERVNMRLVTEEGNIYGTGQERQATYEKGIELIYRVFRKSPRHILTEQGRDRLYNTAAALCKYLDIPIATADEMKKACGWRYTLEDIARVSHFPCREVLLEEAWFRSDAGPLIVYAQNGHKSFLCLPDKSGKGGYTLYDGETGGSEPVTAQKAQQLAPKAHTIYRPFENKPLKVKELLFFGWKSIQRRDYVATALLSLLGAGIGLLLPYLNEKIYDVYIPLGNADTLVQVCLLALGFLLGNLAFSIVKNLCAFRIGSAVENSVQSAVIDRLYNYPADFYSRFESADLASRALQIAPVCKLLSETLLTTVLSVLFSLLYLLRMGGYSGRLTRMAVLLIAVNMLLSFLLGRRRLHLERSSSALNAKLSSVMYQLLSAIAKLRIAGVENRALLQYLEPYAQLKQVHFRKKSLELLTENMAPCFSLLFTAVFYQMMVSGKAEVSFGEFMGFISAFGMFSAAMLGLVDAFLQGSSAIPAYERAKELLETPQEFSENSIVPGKLDGKLEVTNLSFRYSKESDMVLKDISFTIEPGSYIGIVGSSGCGKSTLLRLLLGFETPSRGKVYYDDKDMESLDRRELRKRFGTVLQDGQLISGSIYENIAIAGAHITTERVQEVIRDVGLESDIAEMPMGLHTIIAEGAGTISGGQRQRILIARAIANRPDVIFFDEATSALDNANQALICESLEKLHATRIVVAHRLSTVLHCDRILVMDGGRIVEDGSYEALLAKKGLFYRLVERQMAD